MATAKPGDSLEGYTSVLYNQSHGERENNLVISTPATTALVYASPCATISSMGILATPPYRAVNQTATTARYDST